ncbi:MAG: hypothetical protein E6Q68_04660 [Polynucleobacter sp.]|nr:MAG: hypothetical protein E6Q68_04660 [Polynucleobacter sp.]
MMVSIPFIFFYLVAYLIACIFGLYFADISGFFAASANLKIALMSSLFGGIGGVIYCLRGIYLSASVRGDWNSKWIPWYFIRPFVSTICGGVSFVFLKAGLIALEATSTGSSSDFGFFAFALIAGLNVDKFLEKLQDIALSIWGIEKSRSSKPHE